jgi:molybdate transport system ATP-binding protein
MKFFSLSLEKVSVNLGGVRVLHEISLQIRPNEQWVITGPSGCGKTVLAQVLTGRHFFSGKINSSVGGPEDLSHSAILVEQQHRFRDLSNQENFYYQQRFNSCDADRTVRVAEELSRGLPVGHRFEESPLGNELLQWMRMEGLMNEPLIQLSNGENKRLQLIKALMQEPVFLILDQPFLGLDPKGRELLHGVLNRLIQKGQHILLLSRPQEIPDCFTHVAVLESGTLVSCSLRKDFQASVMKSYLRMDAQRKPGGFPGLQDRGFEIAVRMVDTTIRYGGREVLSKINWQVARGEKCCLTGPNGSGKSTLLSLISGDNPQAYANEIYLFDRRRGSGESIWDLKKKIGFVSPELQLYFDRSANCFEAIASGLFDTIGLFRKLTATQQELVLQWVEIFGLENHRSRLLSQLPAGLQRLALLARALIKTPPLLLLDEPCQGLDEEQTQFFKNLVDRFCSEFDSTLIYVSHYSGDIPGSIHRFLRLENGEIKEDKHTG